MKPTIASWTAAQSAASSTWVLRGLSISAARASPVVPPITRSPTTSTRSTHWSSRRCPGAMGGRVLLPPHPCRFVYPRDTAPLFGLPLCTTHLLHGRSDDRNGALWNVRQTGLTNCRRFARSSPISSVIVKASMPTSSHQSSRRRRAQAGYCAAPIVALCRLSPRLPQPAADDAHHARAMRRPNLCHSECRVLCCPRRP